MQNVIEFLEKVGRDPSLSHATAETLQLALDDAGVDKELGKAIVAGDQSLLASLLGQAPLCAMFMPGEEDDESEDEQEENPGRDPAHSPEKDSLAAFIATA